MFNSFLDVTLLAILQGVAEFLPISSSGHLVIGQHLLDLHEPSLRFDIALHVGTLASIFIFYRRVIARIIMKFEWRYVLKIIASAIPAIIVYFFFRDAIEEMFENTRMVGALLMFTGAVLIGTRYLPTGKKDICFLRAIFMGLGQAIALLPGVSRSGMTIVCARGGRVDGEKAAEFSFLMSAPLILGGFFLQLAKVFGDSAESLIASKASEISWVEICYGTVLSGIVGYFALAILLKTLKGRGFWLFGPYCLCVGLLTLILI